MTFCCAAKELSWMWRDDRNLALHPVRNTVESILTWEEVAASASASAEGTEGTEGTEGLSVNPRNLGIIARNSSDSPAIFQIRRAHSDNVLLTISRFTSVRAGVMNFFFQTASSKSTSFTRSRSSLGVLHSRASIHPPISKSRSTLGSPQ